MQTRSRVRSAVYNRFGTVVAMAPAERALPHDPVAAARTVIDRVHAMGLTLMSVQQHLEADAAAAVGAALVALDEVILLVRALALLHVEAQAPPTLLHDLLELDEMADGIYRHVMRRTEHEGDA